MLCFARRPIILQRAKCAITLRTMHELIGADSTMYIGHYLDLLQVGPYSTMLIVDSCCQYFLAFHLCYSLPCEHIFTARCT